MADYSKSVIKEIIDNIGPRLPGSLEEKKAAWHIKKELEKYCDIVELQEFSTPILKKFIFLKLSTAFLLISVMYYPTSPLFSFIMAILYALSIGMQVFYPDAAYFLLPKKFSANVIGIKKARKKASKKIIFSAHHDSGYILPIFKNQKLGFLILNINVTISVISMLLIFLNYFAKFTTVWAFFFLVCSAAISFFISYTIDSKKMSQGANDNLSGVATILNIAKNAKRMSETELVFISFGSEESDCSGSKYYVDKSTKSQNRAINVNFESVGCGEFFSFLQSESLGKVQYDKKMMQFFSNHIKNNGGKVTNKEGGRYGKSDGGSFVKKGIKSVCVLGTDGNGFIPNWHSSDDLENNINYKNIEALTFASIDFAKALDAKQKNI